MRFAPTHPKAREIGEDQEQCLPVMAGAGLGSAGQGGSERLSWEESGFGREEESASGTRSNI